jgi:hypothetical protein
VSPGLPDIERTPPCGYRVIAHVPGGQMVDWPATNVARYHAASLRRGNSMQRAAE